MPKQKCISDTRMLQVMEYWKQKTGGTQTDFANAIGLYQGNISGIRNGRQSFQVYHIQAAMELIGNGNFNFVFGVENNMFRGEKKRLTPIQQIKQALKELEDDKRNR
ncbi:MAG: hypothetical protein KF862_07300 [Chitinophagaceae bacterium]|nr:hypothetical protein [Chitinophagaceae bacterium]